MYRKFFKQVIDTLLSICGLVVFAIPMIIIAIAIKCESRGPALFKQKRLGLGMKQFTVYKFRTMSDHAYEMGGIVTSSQDPRITRIGSFLRRTSLDELPQMFNIINGTMAIIGPRPILDWEFEPYKNNAFYCKRYDVKSGIFCTVDIHYRALADRDLQFKMDADYVRNISFKNDCFTFLQIIGVVAKCKNIYKEK